MLLQNNADRPVFCRNLRALRLYKDWTQAEVAKKIHIHRSTYSYYETGKAEPSLQTLVDLALLYGVSADYLLGLNQAPTDIAFFHAFEFSGRHEWALNHLQGLGLVVFTSVYGTAHHGAASHSLADDFRALAARSKAARNGKLAVVDDDGRFLAAELFGIFSMRSRN